MLIVSKLESDLGKPGFRQVSYAVQNDANTRALEIELFYNGEPWEIPSGTTAAVSFRKPDLTKGLYDTLPDKTTKAVTYSGNTLTAILAPQVLTCGGKVDVSIALYDSDLDRLGVFPIDLYVSADPSAGEPVSNNYYNFTTFAAVNEAIGNLDELKTSATGSLVSAINELVTRLSEVVIGDGSGDEGSVSGTGGRELELRSANGYIQWRRVGDINWNNLVALSELSGEDGVTPEIAIGTVTTLPSGSDATASFINSTGKLLLNLGIPRGEDGEDGEDGDDGNVPSFSIGTVTTLPAGSNATASITMVNGNPVLNLGIPQGQQGAGASTGGSTEVDPSAVITVVEQLPDVNGEERVVFLLEDEDANSTAGTTIDEGVSTNLTLIHNVEFRRGVVETLNIALPQPVPKALECQVSFTSGDTPTTVTLPEGVVMVPGNLEVKENYRYNLMFWYDGVKVWCTVCAVSLSDNSDEDEEPVVPIAYTLTISKGTGVDSVIVTKTSGYGELGALSSGATVYEGDVLSVSAAAASGYTLDSYTKTVTVNGNVTLTVTATANSTGGDTPSMSGDGSAANPYLISTAAELVALGEEVDNGDTKSGVFYALANDIDLDGIAWNPIGASYKSEGTDTSGSFAGTLDGRGHIISNISVSGMQYAGLFGSNFNGTVMNLGMEGGSISTSYANSTCGAIARKGGGKIINCYSTVPTSAVARSAGIIDEITSGGMVLGCYQAAAVTGTSGKCYAFKAATTTTGDIHYCLWDSDLTTNGYSSTTNATNNTGMSTAELQVAADTLNGNLSAVATKAGISVDKLCTWENRVNGYPRLVVA